MVGELRNGTSAELLRKPSLRMDSYVINRTSVEIYTHLFFCFAKSTELLAVKMFSVHDVSAVGDVWVRPEERVRLPQLQICA